MNFMDILNDYPTGLKNKLWCCVCAGGQCNTATQSFISLNVRQDNLFCFLICSSVCHTRWQILIASFQVPRYFKFGLSEGSQPRCCIVTMLRCLKQYTTWYKAQQQLVTLVWGWWSDDPVLPGRCWHPPPVDANVPPVECRICGMLFEISPYIVRLIVPSLRSVCHRS